MINARAVLAQPLALPLILIGGIAVASSSQVTLDDGTTCTVIHAGDAQATGGGLSSSVTAGGGKVTSSTTIDGRTTTSHSAGGSTSSSAGTSASSSTSSSSAGSSVTAGSTGSGSFSTASATQPDGTVVTRRSDGTCDITKPKP